MKLIFKSLKNPPNDIEQLNTVVFIDYESLYFSFLKQYSKPSILDELVNEVKLHGKITKIKVFGDFTNSELIKEKSRIRTITSEIIDCGYISSELKKDFTDFIMLDHIYQEVIQNPPAEQFVLLTGDGQFSSAATFLRTYMNKTVGVFGVMGSLSSQLCDCATWTIQINVLDRDDAEYQKNLLVNLKSATKKGLLPTFMKTVEHTAKRYGGDSQKYEYFLRQLIDDGYIRSELCKSLDNCEFRMLIVDWERVDKELRLA